MADSKLITKTLFEDSLREYFDNKKIQILGYTNSAAVLAGDNYTSDLFRTSITYGTGVNGHKETISVIVKCFPHDEHMQSIVNEIQLFEKESEMYKHTLPALHDILGHQSTLAAECIYYTDKPQKVIILQDLTRLGFIMSNRQEGFDLKHCLMIVKKITFLHAASMVLYEKEPVLFSNYKNALYCDTKFIREWVTSGYKGLTEACKQWPGFEKYAIKLEALQDTFFDRVLASSKRKLGGFNVLNHGDCWVNNFMFTYQPDKKLKDFRFVDYQLAVYTSPAIDLYYFWVTSPKLSVKIKHLDTILDYYYAQLLATLTELKYSIELVPTREQFRKEWTSRAFYGLAAAVTSLPIVISPNHPEASLDNFIDESGGKNSFRYHVFHNEYYKKHMSYLLPYFDNIGALNSY